MNNIHISYTLFSPGQNYERVINKIKTLGGWARVHDSFWYVKTNLGAVEVRDAVRSAMDSNDSLYVVNASDNTSAWFNLPKDVQDHILRNWSSRAYV